MLATVVLLAGCGSGSSGTPGNAKSSLKVVFSESTNSILPPDVTKVMLNVKPVNKASYTPAPLDITNMTTVLINSLTDNETYTFRIDAYNSSNTVTWQGSTTAVMLPAPAANLISIVCNPIASVAYKSRITDWNTGLVGNPGVTVTTIGLTPEISTNSDADGYFTLTGIPKSNPFTMKFSKATYTDLYTAQISLTSDADGSNSPYTMILSSDFTSKFGTAPGTGVSYSVNCKR